ncbi:MAG: NAD(P)-dependent oxidoreductase [Edaphobacter sp.]
MKIFVAGASGAIGQPLFRKLNEAGHDVVALIRSQEGAKKLLDQGCEVVVADALDQAAVESAVRSVDPEVIIDELTSLPRDLADFAKRQPGDTKLRLEGGANLLRAAALSGARRFLQQSGGFFLKTTSGLADEKAPFCVDASPGVAGSSQMYTRVEELVLSSPLQPVLLRYGFFYGPGTWYAPDGGYADLVRQQKLPMIGNGEAVWSWVHIDDAADATVAALEAPSGIYNIVDNDPSPVRVWLPAFAASLGAPLPPRITETQALQEAGADAVFYGTKLMGADNAKAKRVLGFHPRRLEWLQREVPQNT